MRIVKLVRIASTCGGFLLGTAISGFAAPQLIEDLVNLRFQLDARVFAVMAAVHAGGFDPEATAATPNPVPGLVRERLAGIGSDLRERLVNFCKARDSEEDPAGRQAKYVSYALLLNGPPDFSIAYKPDQLPAGVRQMLGFESLVAELWHAGDMGSLWEEVRPFYAREIEGYRPLIREMIIGTLQYMRTEPRVSLDRQVTFIPDLLNAQGLVNARNIGPNYVLVVGPSRTDRKPVRSVRHEYLHFLLDPLFSKYVAYLPEEEPFMKRVNEQPAAPGIYRQNFKLMVTESLLQMVELRLDRQPDERAQAALLAAYDQGLILAPYFEASLRRFEKGAGSLPEIFQAMIEGIRWEVESKRGESVAALRRQVEVWNAQAKETAARAESRAEIRGFLSEANQLLVTHEFGRARELLEKVLQSDHENAGALFGLAQIASREQSAEKALDLYERAAANARDESWIAAWSYVHRGNIYRALDEPEKARAEWSRVLLLQGELRGAGEAARKSLDQATP